jgi:hypothetical protein
MLARTAVQRRSRPKTELKLVPAEQSLSAELAQVAELTVLCQALLYVAQKYTPTGPDAYTDAATVIQCGKQLQQMGCGLEMVPQFNAPTHDTNKSDMILTSVEYRYLRNKSIAGFATIADLGLKTPSLGTADYVVGLRAGYKRASDLAIAFLEDVYNAG